MIQLAGRLRLVHVTTWLIAPEQNLPRRSALTAASLLHTHVHTLHPWLLGLDESDPRVL